MKVSISTIDTYCGLWFVSPKRESALFHDAKAAFQIGWRDAVLLSLQELVATVSRPFLQTRTTTFWSKTLLHWDPYLGSEDLVKLWKFHKVALGREWTHDVSVSLPTVTAKSSNNSIKGYILTASVT